MNVLATASLVLAATLATTFTMPVAAAAPLPSGHAVLVVPCGPGNRPSQRAVAELLGTNNAHEVYAGRERLMAQVRNACRKAGIAQVAVVGRATETRVAAEATPTASAPIAGN
jgi:hypothetical protein